MGIKNKNYHRKEGGKLILLPVAGLAVLSSVFALGAAPSTYADTSATSTVTVNVDAVISIGVTDIEFDLTAPSPAGTFASGTGTVNVKTNDKSGYSVYLTSNSTTSTSMDHESLSSAKIQTIASTQTINASHTAFDNGSTASTWGWSNDGTTFYPVTVKGTKSTASVPTLYRQTNAASPAGDSSTLTVGVTGNSALPSGKYTSTLLLTAIPNSNTATIADYDDTI